jgi:protein BCP1
MYSMLLEEIRWANEEKEPYEFTHYLILSKTYTEVESKLDAEDDRPSKKSKKVANGGAGELFYFHPEDEVLERFAAGSGGFEYDKQGEEGSSDSKRAFQELGVKPQGHLVLIEKGKFADAVKAVGEYLGSETA